MNDRPAASIFSRRSSAVSLLAISALLFSAGGCGNWSSDVRRYREVLGDAHPTMQRPFDAAQPLSLMRALHMADADNEAIALRGEDYVQALAEKMRQAGTFLPTLSLAPSYSLTHINSGAATVIPTGVGGTGAEQIVGGASETYHQFSVPLNASVTGSLSQAANLQAAGRTADQQAQLLLDERETILLQVVQSYYTTLKAERQASVYENSLKFKAEKVRDQEARLKLESVRPLDLAQSQADFAGTHASLLQARADAANARSALGRLIGAPIVAGPLEDGFAPPAKIPGLDDWQRHAFVARQDLLAAARALESARLSLDAAIKEYFPSVTVNFSYFLYNDPTSVQTWSGIFSANIPLFSALSIEADVRKAWSVYRQAALSESQTRRQVVDDVNQNYQNLNNNRLRIVDLRIQVEAAQRAADLSERSYQLGSVSNLDRLTQQDALLTAQLNLVSEVFNEKTNYLGLLRATGALASAVVSTDDAVVGAR